MNTLLIFIGIVTAMLAGVPVAFAFALGGFGLIYLSGIDPAALMPAATRSVDSFTLLALPMYILVGALLRNANLSERLIELSKMVVGKIRGGLGLVTILTSAVFGAISGSASAAITSVGSVMIPELERHGYPRGYATGLVAASSLLSLLLPPSIPMIVFAMTAQISIRDAFLSTIIPALLMICLYSLINAVYTRRFPALNDSQREEYEKVSESWQQKALVLRRSFLVLLLPVVILGGIYGGIFTATESAAIGCLYLLIIGMFVYRSLNLKKTCDSLYSSMVSAGVIILLLFFIFIISRIMVLEGVPQSVSALLTNLSDNPVISLLLINLALLVLGMLVDDISGNILSASILLPVAVSLGVEPVHFVAISVINLSIGNLSPPVAPMLYLAGMVAGKQPLHEYLKPTMCFLLFGALPVVLAVTFIPAMSIGFVQLFR